MEQPTKAGVDRASLRGTARAVPAMTERLMNSPHRPLLARMRPSRGLIINSTRRVNDHMEIPTVKSRNESRWLRKRSKMTTGVVKMTTSKPSHSEFTVHQATGEQELDSILTTPSSRSTQRTRSRAWRTNKNFPTR